MAIDHKRRRCIIETRWRGRGWRQWRPNAYTAARWARDLNVGPKALVFTKWHELSASRRSPANSERWRWVIYTRRRWRRRRGRRDRRRGRGYLAIAERFRRRSTRGQRHSCKLICRDRAHCDGIPACWQGIRLSVSQPVPLFRRGQVSWLAKNDVHCVVPLCVVLVALVVRIIWRVFSIAGGIASTESDPDLTAVYLVINSRDAALAWKRRSEERVWRAVRPQRQRSQFDWRRPDRAQDLGRGQHTEEETTSGSEGVDLALVVAHDGGGVSIFHQSSGTRADLSAATCMKQSEVMAEFVASHVGL